MNTTATLIYGPQCAACGDETCTAPDAHHTVTTFATTTELLDRLEASGDRVQVAYDVNGRTVSVEGTMSVPEARVSIDVALSLGATRVSVRRFEI